MADANKVIEVLKGIIADLSLQLAITKAELDEMQDKVMAAEGAQPIDFEEVEK